jgi:hypothetical protein
MGNFVTPRELLTFVEEPFQKFLTEGWLYSFLSRHCQDVKRAIVLPQKPLRLQMRHRYLQGDIKLLRAHVPLAPSELISHPNETASLIGRKES